MTRPGSPGVAFGRDTARIALGVDDLCRHTIVFGSSGSGKSTRAFNPILASMLGDIDAGAFVIAPKAETVRDVMELARSAGKIATVVEPGSARGLDLLTGNPSFDAASVREVFRRFGEADEKLLEAAVTRVKNALRLLQAASLTYYNFEHLMQYCYDDHFAEEVKVHSGNSLRLLDAESEAAWTIRDAFNYESLRLKHLGPETKQRIHLTLARVLEPLLEVRIAKTFTRQDSVSAFDSIFAGGVVVLHVPTNRFGHVAQTICTLAKRRFFAFLEHRRSTDPDHSRPIAFAVDDYRQCISETDADALGFARAANCMLLATVDGVSSLYSVMAKASVDATLQNFTQKMFFKTDDADTLALLERVARNASEPIDARTLFGMHRNQALCHLTVGDHSVNAVLQCEPLYAGRDVDSARSAVS